MAVNIHPQYLYDDEGEPKSVLLSFEEFRALLADLEDYADARILDEAVANSPGSRPLADVFAEIDAEG